MELDLPLGEAATCDVSKVDQVRELEAVPTAGLPEPAGVHQPGDIQFESRLQLKDCLRKPRAHLHGLGPGLRGPASDEELSSGTAPVSTRLPVRDGVHQEQARLRRQRSIRIVHRPALLSRRSDS